MSKKDDECLGYLTCEDCNAEYVAKIQLLADLDAYRTAVEEEDWDEAEDAALNCYEILRAFLDDDTITWKKNNQELINATVVNDMIALDSYENLGDVE